MTQDTRRNPHESPWFVRGLSAYVRSGDVPLVRLQGTTGTRRGIVARLSPRAIPRITHPGEAERAIMRAAAEDAPVSFRGVYYRVVSAGAVLKTDAMNLPTRPTERTDTRAARLHGDSVEVDGIPAPALRELVSDAIVREVDQRALETPAPRKSLNVNCCTG